MDIYAENILDHYHHPRGKVDVTGPTVSHKEENLSCGDELTLSLKVEEGKIVELGWQGTGCAISQASMSLLFEKLIGTSVKDAEKISGEDIHKFLGVPVGPRRVKCALLGLHTLKNALRKMKGLGAQSWTETVTKENGAVDEN